VSRLPAILLIAAVAARNAAAFIVFARLSHPRPGDDPPVVGLGHRREYRSSVTRARDLGKS
jgi:hypothetical protein